MNVYLVLAHPTPGSFNHALAQAVADTARGRGDTVWFHDLYAERFDPVMTSAELARDATLPAEIERHCAELAQANLVVVVHPNWWSAPPAILRGWADRCLRAGRAYNFVPDGQGGAKAVGLLPARAALVLNTANTPQDREEALYGDPLQVHWTRVVFGLCGTPRVLRRNFAPIITSRPDQRDQWLAETRELAAAALAAAASPG